MHIIYNLVAEPQSCSSRSTNHILAPEASSSAGYGATGLGGNVGEQSI